jgi:hypothetical protein
MNKLNDVTFIFPLRVDSKEREENLCTVIDLLIAGLNAKISILEADNEQKFFYKTKMIELNYSYIFDIDTIFYRTKYINYLLREVTTPICAIWDTDVIFTMDQIIVAVEAIRNGLAIMSFPYDGSFYTMSPDISLKFKKTHNEAFLSSSFPLYGYYAVGGAFLVNTKLYLDAGGENENIYGWGPDDIERVKRMEILELPIFRAKGPLYHLYHPRGNNSRFFDDKRKYANIDEFLKVCAMNKNELKDYICTWREK